jgi:flagellar basal body-associated protein FliL
MTEDKESQSIDDTIDIDSQLEGLLEEEDVEGVTTIKEGPPPDDAQSGEDVEAGRLEGAPPEEEVVDEEEGEEPVPAGPGESHGDGPGGEVRASALTKRLVSSITPLRVIMALGLLMLCIMGVKALRSFDSEKSPLGSGAIYKPVTPMETREVDGLFIPLKDGEQVLRFGVVIVMDGHVGRGYWRTVETSLRASIMKILAGLSEDDLRGAKGIKRIKWRLRQYMEREFPQLRVLEVYVTDYFVI